MSMEKPKLKVILGPTAAGKTAYAIDLARKEASSVVSADSRQVYTGMNIGTAKPEEAWLDDPHDHMTPDVVHSISDHQSYVSATAAEGETVNGSIQGVDHYLLNISNPNLLITLPQWQERAFEVIDYLHVQNKDSTPLLVGGTMLYIDSVVYDYLIPNVAPDENLRALLERESSEELYSQLIEKDPDAGKFIESHHTQRIIRALEVIQTTGRPFSEQRRRQEPRYDVDLIGLLPSDGLEDKILERSRAMFDTGLLDEARKLREKYGDISLLQTMGYKQALEVVDKIESQNSAVKSFCQAQMRYMRRQMSWWKRDKNIRWV